MYIKISDAINTRASHNIVTVMLSRPSLARIGPQSEGLTNIQDMAETFCSCLIELANFLANNNAIY